MPNIDQLASEIFLLILDHVNTTDLYACTLVNKSFHIHCTPLLWHQVHIYSNRILTRLIDTLNSSSSSSFGHHIHSLIISSLVNNLLLSGLIQHTPHLEHLQLESANDITDTSFQHVSTCCPALGRLLLRSSGITIDSLRSLVQQPQCIELTLDHLQWLDYVNLLYSLPRGQYKVLDLRPINIDAYEESDYDDGPNVDALTCALSRQQPSLTSLVLRGPDHRFYPFIPTALTRGFCWPHLTHLGLDGCDYLTDDMVLAFIKLHPHLQILALNGSDLLTDATLDNIAYWLPRIRKLDMHNTEELTLDGLCRFVKKNGTATAAADDDSWMDGGVGCYGCEIFLEHDGDDQLDFLDDMVDGGCDKQLELMWLATKQHAERIKANGGRQ